MNEMRCHECYRRVPNMNGDYCCTFYIHRSLRKTQRTGPPVGTAWQMCKGKHFEPKATTIGADNGASIRNSDKR